MVGYRVCGPRAVRVDILERLADLIRPALSWRPGMPGDKPAGAIDGRGFTITVAMTSLVGCSGEDFAAILRALGYRMERRPAPPPAAATPSPAPAPATAIEAALMGPTDSEPPTLAPADPAPVPESAAVQVPEPVPEATTQPEQAPAEETAPSEPMMIEIWRPGRPEGARRPRRKTEERRPQPDRPAPTAVSAPADGAPKEGEPRPEARRPRPDERPRRAERPRREDSARRDERPRNDERPRPKRNERSRREREREDWKRELPRERKERVADPNSPFAALAALKARLEAGKKDD